MVCFVSRSDVLFSDGIQRISTISGFFSGAYFGSKLLPSIYLCGDAFQTIITPCTVTNLAVPLIGGVVMAIVYPIIIKTVRNISNDVSCTRQDHADELV